MQDIKARPLTPEEAKREAEHSEMIELAVSTTTLDRTTFLDPPLLRKLARELAPVIASANDLTIKTAGDMIEAKTYKDQLTWRVKRLDGGRTKIATTFRTKVDAMINPVLEPMKEAERNLKSQMSTWSNEQDRIEAEAKRKAEAEAERRRKIQQAAVERGATARKEIVAAPVAPAPTPIPGKVMLLTYIVTDIESLPEELVIKSPNSSAIRERVLAIQKATPKGERKGEIEQTIPGVEMTWTSTFR